MKINLFLLGVAVFLLSAVLVNAEENQPKDGYVSVYYFHGNARCANCRKIEQYSEDVVRTYFKDELSTGRIIFKVVNVEEKGNEHFTGKYELYTRSVVLSLVKSGKEVKSENLSKIWECLGDKEKFYQYVKTSIESFVGEI